MNPDSNKQTICATDFLHFVLESCLRSYNVLETNKIENQDNTRAEINLLHQSRNPKN